MSQYLRCYVPGRVGLLLAAMTVMALLGSGCRLVAAGGASPNVTIKAQDTMRFDPPSVTVPVGQTIQFTLVNDGSLVHDFVLAEGVDQPVKVEANGKSSAGATFSFARAGTYTFVCTQPGHEAAGMEGTITAR